MISSLNPSTQLFLSSLSAIGERMDRAQRQVTTGLRVSRISDDPDMIPALLQSRANLSLVQQMEANLNRVKGEVDAGEQALQSAVQLFERARTRGVQGATSTQTVGSRAVLAQEIGSILEQMVGLAGTVVEGRHLFSGDSDQQVPYTIDVTQPVPLSAYLGAAATREAQHPNGTTFRVGRTAQEIFDAATPEDNVFAALTVLRDALLANDEPAIFSAVAGLGRVGEHLNSELAFYGSAQNKIVEAGEFGASLRVQLQTQIAGLEDADLTQAILDLNQAQTQQEAALVSHARLPRTTLFDYLG
jgi:flagellar hook-associated protein 3 FlgL